MLTNYYSIDENTTVGSFLRETSEKKNMHYIILETDPETFVDIRTIGLKIHNPKEKLKSLKKPLSQAETQEPEELLYFLIDTGERVIKHKEGYFDFLHALEHIKQREFDFLKNSLKTDARMEVYALNPEDKLSTAKNIFTKQNINLLPIIDGMKIVGELRIQDLVNGNLFNNDENMDMYSKKRSESPFNLPVETLMNSRPLTIPHTATLGDALNLMLEKRVPSLVVTKDDNKIYSVISYKDIFKQLRKESEIQEFNIEIIGTDELFEDEKHLIRKAAKNSMERIKRMSDYNLLKISFKTHGNTEGATHQKKVSVNLVLSKGNKVLHVDNEISPGTNDETYNDKVKGKWNIPLMVQDALSALESKVKDEKKKMNGQNVLHS